MGSGGGGGRRVGWAILLLVIALVIAAYSIRAPRGSQQTKNVDLSALIRRARTHPKSIRRVVFQPSSQGLQATLTSGKQLDSNYPTPQAGDRLQQLLETKSVDYTSQPVSTGGGGWWAAALSWLVPLSCSGRSGGS